MVKVIKAPLDSGRWTDVGTLVRSVMPSHTVYCEPWFLEGEVFFQKPPVGVEIINDPTDKVIEFYTEALNRPDHLQFLIESTLQSDTLRRLAEDIRQGRIPADSLGRAWAAWVGYSSQNINRSAWLTESIGYLQNEDFVRQKGFSFDKMIAARLKGVHIWSRPVADVIRQADSPDTFFYLHPTDWKQLKEVTGILSGLKGKVALLCTTPKMTEWAMQTDYLFLESDGRQKGNVIWLNFKVSRTLFK